MFINNKYSIWYHSVINKAITEKRTKTLFFEKHHIIPRCLGGPNSEDNLVYLTFKEHFICHWLLTKMVDDPHHVRKLYNAFACMSRKSRFNFGRKISARMYELSRKYNALARKGLSMTEERKEIQRKNSLKSWKNDNKRRKETGERLLKFNLGVPKSFETKRKISETLTGVKHSEERNARKSQRQRKVWRLVRADGEVIITDNLKKFCFDYNYRPDSLSSLKAGRISYHKDIIEASII